MTGLGKAKLLKAVSAVGLAACIFNAGCSRDTQHDINTLPQTVRAIKFDPFVGIARKFDAEERIDFWRERGFNAIYMIVHNMQGQIAFESANKEHVYNTTLFGEDLLRRMADAARKKEVMLAVGNWMFRDTPQFVHHAAWRQINGSGKMNNESLICPNSPYMDEEVYPFYTEIAENYGIKNIFLQEMWFGWDDSRSGKRSCYCKYCLGAFTELTGQAYDRETLVAAMKTDKALEKRWDDFHFETLIGVVKKLEEIVGEEGTVMWHNPQNYWGDFKNNPQMFTNRFIGDMSLYPDESLFAKKDPNEIDPYLEYRHVAGFIDIFGNAGAYLEYYSLYGMPGLNRPVTREDIVGIHLAARAAGMANFVVEQDAMIDWAEQKAVGVWDAFGEVNRRIDPLFSGMSFKGKVRAVDGSFEGDGVYGGVWQDGEQRKIVIVGNRLDAQPAAFKLFADSGSLQNERGEQTEAQGALQPGEIRMFVVD